jgi:peptidoglycan/xylan/chitin deacetylase (PgdA/CDA1 family)
MDLYTSFYATIHRTLSRNFPACLWVGDPSCREVALTFDDGPHRQFTPELLRVLEQRQVHASFFVLGCQVDNTPEIARAIYQAGHWIGLHGYWHFPFLSTHGLKEDLERTRQSLARACNLDPTTICDVRPPFGFFTPEILNALTTWGYRPVMWQVLADDSMHPGTPVIVQRILQQTTNGALIVLHDGNDGCGDVAEATDLIIQKLSAEGYQFVTVDALWQRRKI